MKKNLVIFSLLLAFFSNISHHSKSGAEKVLNAVDAADIDNLGVEITYKYVYDSNWDLKIIGNTMYLLDDICVLRIIKLIE